MSARLFLGALLVLGACASEQDEDVPPVRLEVLAREVRLAPNGQPDPASLTTALGNLGTATAVSADITGLRPEEAARTRSTLVAAGIDPDRVHVAPAGGVPVLRLSRVQATTADCGSVVRRGWLGDVSPGVGRIGRCVQQNNLAEMLVDPGDLVRSPMPQPSSGARAARAVRMFEEGQQPPLPRGNQQPSTGLPAASAAATQPATTQGEEAAPAAAGAAATP